MRVVAVRIANRVLHVADERVEPVADVERAVRAELEVDRAEVGIGLERRSGSTGSAAKPEPLRDILYCSVPWNPMQLLSR